MPKYHKEKWFMVSVFLLSKLRGALPAQRGCRGNAENSGLSYRIVFLNNEEIVECLIDSLVVVILD